ncbi:MAG: two-component system sensor histidine kinase CreC [Gammaproteobacteria bacterium]|nr:two-component system sensor histidine kinase CreC [Gammaproteobacteria bacterium]
MKKIASFFGSFSLRLYLVYFLMVGGTSWFIASRSLQAIDVSVSQAAEEVLVDTANLLAEQLSHNLDNGTINAESFREHVPNYLQRKLDATIYDNIKVRPDLQLYITDDKGIVLFDSTGQATGKDFSRWLDVSKTLSGQYGARSSPLDYSLADSPPSEKGLFVAAPIVAEDDIVGVLTVVKGQAYLGDYVINSNRNIKLYALLVFAISLFTGMFITWWLGRSVKKLSRYANQLGRGNYVKQPRIIHSEFKPLANSMESMYQDLEGKEYVENYVHTLAHELKSPLTGIIATTELLQQPNLPEGIKQNFATNLHDSATRMNLLIERLLHLAALENRHQLNDVTEINVSSCISKVLRDYTHRCQEKQITISCDIDNVLVVSGDDTLISQSVSNLIDNAIDFSHTQSTIYIKAYAKTEKSGEKLCICVIDGGDGIADFAQQRLFERFFSTPRPDSQQRSSGLGLAFVKEAMTLHGGDVSLSNHETGGAVATLTFPINSKRP